MGERGAPDTCDVKGSLPLCVSGAPRPLRPSASPCFPEPLGVKKIGWRLWVVNSLVNYLQSDLSEMRSF